MVAQGGQSKVVVYQGKKAQPLQTQKCDQFCVAIRLFVFISVCRAIQSRKSRGKKKKYIQELQKRVRRSFEPLGLVLTFDGQAIELKKEIKKLEVDKEIKKSLRGRDRFEDARSTEERRKIIAELAMKI